MGIQDYAIPFHLDAKLSYKMKLRAILECHYFNIDKMKHC